MSGYVGNRGFNPRELLIKYGNSQKFMNWFNINLKLWLDKSPVTNYRNSRGI